MDVLRKILQDGFILVFNQEGLDVVKTACALQKAGINNLELTCRVSDSMKKLRKLKATLPDFACGAASLVDSERVILHGEIPTVKEAVEAGADYLVSAVNFTEESYRNYSKSHPMIPGCGTASEIINQFELGASFCKLFPAGVIGGPAFIKNIDPAIHSLVNIMPTGGTNEMNIPDYVKAGCLVLGGSFSMIDSAIMKQIIEDQDYDSLAEEFKKIKQLIDKCRKAQYPQLDFSTASVEEISSVTGRNFNQ